jgi:hypothetical protein
MTTDPRTSEDIYRSLRNSLTGKIATLTNFTENSFNYIWTQAFADEVREAELRTIAAELSGLIDYSGKQLTQDDLDDLDIDDSVDPEEINQYMQESHLDEYVKAFGISRFEGSRAIGSVDIQTQSPGVITIPSGTIVTTAPDSDGNTLRFEVAETVETENNETEVTDVEIRAVNIGKEYNISAGSIIRFEEPPVGVTGIEQLSDTTGGENRESTEELRTRAKQAVPSSSDGGTVAGIKGRIRSDVEGVGEGDVIVDEFTDGSTNYADVIVDGGLEEDVLAAIESGRPVAIQHNLVRPKTIQLGLDIDLLGEQVDVADVENAIKTYLLELRLGDNFYDDILVREILDADDGIQNVDKQFIYIAKVQNEQFTYNTGQSEYRLSFTYTNNGSISIDTENTAISSSDYTVEDRSGDGHKETIVFSKNLNNGEGFSVDYDVTNISNPQSDWYRLDLVRDELFNWNKNYQEDFDYSDGEDIYKLDFVPFAASVSISDDSGDTYTLGNEFTLSDESGDGFAQSINWSVGSSSPDDTEEFTVEYTQKVYKTEYDITGTADEEITDEDDDNYIEGTDYQIVDYQSSGEFNAIEWLNNPANLSDDEEFYFTYNTEGDRNATDREKISPADVSTYLDVSVI